MFLNIFIHVLKCAETSAAAEPFGGAGGAPWEDLGTQKCCCRAVWRSGDPWEDLGTEKC